MSSKMCDAKKALDLVEIESQCLNLKIARLEKLVAASERERAIAEIALGDGETRASSEKRGRAKGWRLACEVMIAGMSAFKYRVKGTPKGAVEDCLDIVRDVRDQGPPE